MNAKKATSEFIAKMVCFFFSRTPLILNPNICYLVVCMIMILTLSARGSTLDVRNMTSIDVWIQVLYSIPDQSKSGSACHMTRSANHRRHSVLI